MSELTRHHLNVKNQFYFQESSKTACVAISIMALYVMYDIIGKLNEMPTDAEWMIVLQRGARLWEEWKKGETIGNRMFPTSEEILRLKACDQFHRVFNTIIEAPHEYWGLVRLSEAHNKDNMGKTLYASMSETVKLCFQHTKNAYLLLRLPMNITISLMIRISKDDQSYSIFIFDSHGSKQTGSGCELVEFSDFKKAFIYIVTKNDIPKLDNLAKEFEKLYTPEEMEYIYSYALTVFYK
jgi:hypothetical protein